jgi:hypothetical protein
MPKLNVSITEYPNQVEVSGTYQIIGVQEPVPQQTRQGRAIILRVRSEKGEEMTLFMPYYDAPSSRTNFARVLEAFGTDTDLWVAKKLKVEVDESGKNRIYPITLV